MTESLVERVARALSIADGMHPEACSNDEDEIPAWTLYVDDARAAIAAMREHFKQQPEYHWAAIESIDEALK